MAKSNANSEERGTFAKLYDVQEQMSRRNSKPLGRPRKKVQRKPTTIHLTQAENRKLSKLHLLVSDQISVNRSELVGVAIEVLAALVEKKGGKALEETRLEDIESFRDLVFDFIKS
ncbi:MAG: hypothetical protein H6631_02695 [Anaerolineaceae bacterium]|nr:hypothetical protein [Anaerolineaceae bacterium]